jgi:hypothetical protein
MRKPTSNGVTPVYARQHSRTPTLPQLNAIDLLATGQNDTAAAKALNLDRTTVTKWRLYDPVFQAALNRRRAEIWSTGIDRLRSLIPKALDALADGLDCKHPPHRLKAAVELLKLVPLPEGALTVGPTDPQAIVEAIVNARRAPARSNVDDLLDSINSKLPPFDDHVEQVRRELEAMLVEGPTGESPPG